MPMYPYLGYKMQSGIKLPSPKWEGSLPSITLDIPNVDAHVSILGL
jgi:hypothetical protein